MIIPSIVKDTLETGVLSPEQEAVLYILLRNYPCTEADLNALEVLLDKLVKREVRYATSFSIPCSEEVLFCQTFCPTVAVFGPDL
ncbi:MAG: hypothetical protein Q6L60_14495 [Thermostichus sp. HHBFW_bins_43]